MEPIRLRFIYTPENRERAYRLYRRRSGRALRNTIIGGIFLLIALADFWVNYYPAFQYDAQYGLEAYFPRLVIWGFALILWFGLPSAFLRRIREWRQRNEPPVFYDLIFDDKGAAYTSATVDVKVAWVEFKTIYEDQYSFLLIAKTNENEYWTIPKQYFASPRDLDEFQRLLQAHIAPP